MSATFEVMRRLLKISTVVVSAVLLWGVSPEAALACERCFGAGADSATVRAIGASMLLLVVLMGFMGGSIFSFFNRAHGRAVLLEGDISRAQPEERSATDTSLSE